MSACEIEKQRVYKEAAEFKAYLNAYDASQPLVTEECRFLLIRGSMVQIHLGSPLTQGNIRSFIVEPTFVTLLGGPSVAQTGQQSRERSSLRHADSEASGAVRFAALIGVHHFRFGFSAAPTAVPFELPISHWGSASMTTALVEIMCRRGGRGDTVSVYPHHQGIGEPDDGQSNQPPAAMRVEMAYCFFAIELSKKTWVIGFIRPFSSKISRRTLEAFGKVYSS
jgi:hypothetical protein